jgi:hypothetical protein
VIHLDRRVVAVAVTLSTATSLTALAGFPTADATGHLRAVKNHCPVLNVIEAGGDGHAGAGKVAGGEGRMIARLARGHHLATRTQLLRFKTASVKVLKPTPAERSKYQSDQSRAESMYQHRNVVPYSKGVGPAAGKAVTMIRKESTSCPNARMVLVGFAQGAMALHQAGLKLEAKDPAAANRIKDAILVADGDQLPDSAAHEAGSAAADAEGVRPSFGLTDSDDANPQRTRNLCNAGDLVCNWTTDVFTGSVTPDLQAHASYGKQPGALRTLAKEAVKGLQPPKFFFVGAPGTGKSPAKVGPYRMRKSGRDGRPLSSRVRTVKIGRKTIHFNRSVRHDRIGKNGGWLTWSNGYKRDVYWTGGATSLSIKLPKGTRAFYVYIEPDAFKDYDVVAKLDDGTTSGQATVKGKHGAAFFGFYATGAGRLHAIQISGGGDDFAVGEFGISK